MTKFRNNYIAALDIGTTKIACFIARITDSGDAVIEGIGYQISQGVKSGTIIDIKLAEKSIRSAVGAAEQMAGINIDRVILNISGSKQRSHHIKTEMPIAGQEVSARDLSRIAEQGYNSFKNNDREIIHCLPIDYAIDGASGIKNPRGMFGNYLESSLHIIDASSTNIFNMANCLAKCHLDIEDYISSPYASALAVLNNDEKELGSTVIDFGGGNTSVAVFKGGSLVHVDTIPVGGLHITNDIALGLSTNIESAERIKTLYGNALFTSTDEQEIIDIPQISEDGESETNHIQRSTLVNIIRPRIEEMLELIENRLDAAGYRHTGGSIVITGGASQLTGLKESIEGVFRKQTRIGNPKFIEGMAESNKNPAFATCAGIIYNYIDKINRNENFSYYSQNPIKKVANWFRNNF